MSDTATLHSLIQNATGGYEGEDELMLYTGTWTDPVPRALTLDPVLSATDAYLWLHLRARINQPGQTASMPSYRTLIKGVKCSRPTLARSLMVLRALRWITAIPLPRKAGRFQGNLYLVHDEPLDLGTVLDLDPQYLTFIQAGIANANKRVATVCLAVNEAIQTDAAEGKDITEQKLAMGVLSDRIGSWAKQLERPDKGVLVAPAHRVKNINSVELGEKLDRVKNFNSATVLVVRSSKSTKVGLGVKDGRTPENTSIVDNDQLPSSSSGEVQLPYPSREPEPSFDDSPSGPIWPNGFSPNRIAPFQVYLDTLPASIHQDVIDEFIGKLRRYASSDNPIKSETGYFNKICINAREGKFYLSQDGKLVRDSRKHQAHSATPTPPGETADNAITALADEKRHVERMIDYARKSGAPTNLWEDRLLELNQKMRVFQPVSSEHKTDVSGDRPEH